MLSDHTPNSGASLLRPIGLPLLERSLLQLQAKLQSSNRLLSAEDTQLFQRLESAWEYYRPSQPRWHQSHIDRLFASVYEHGRFS